MPGLPPGLPGAGRCRPSCGAAVTGTEDAAIRGQLLRIVEPISGEVSIVKYEAVRDRQGRVSMYKVWVHKE